MPRFADYDQHDALGLAELVRQGAVSVRDLLDEAIRRRDALNPQLNAVVHNMDELAWRAIEAGLPQGPFTGVPFLLKDLLAAYAGVPLTHGSRALRQISEASYYDTVSCTLSKSSKTFFPKTWRRLRGQLEELAFCHPHPLRNSALSPRAALTPQGLLLDCLGTVVCCRASNYGTFFDPVKQPRCFFEKCPAPLLAHPQRLPALAWVRAGDVCHLRR